MTYASTPASAPDRESSRLGETLGLLLLVAFVVACLTSGFMLDFVFYYPLFMSFIWIIGGIHFYLRWEMGKSHHDYPPKLTEYPFVSIFIPCFNEGMNIVDTIASIDRQNYPNFEIIAVNDGSNDKTGDILDDLAKKYPRLRCVHLACNQGKAMALCMAAVVGKGEFIVCVDGDALLHPNATLHLIKPMLLYPRVGAVTGNPRVRNRASLLGKIQVGEFSSIIGLIKRSQRGYGHIFTISGVITAFRRSALYDCGLWDPNIMTEDIDVSWALQLRHWQIQYEPAAVTWILMPETFRGLWKQRLRWAQGGAEVYFKNITRIWRWQNCRMWMLVADFCLSATWTYAFILSAILWVLGKYVQLPGELYVPTIWPPAYWGLLLATANILQAITAIILESRYDHKLSKYILYVVWYPFFFWMLSLLTTLVGVPKAFFAARSNRAIWVSPDRGFQ